MFNMNLLRILYSLSIFSLDFLNLIVVLLIKMLLCWLIQLFTMAFLTTLAKSGLFNLKSDKNHLRIISPEF